jgi:hypothetical protein
MVSFEFGKIKIVVAGEDNRFTIAINFAGL